MTQDQIITVLVLMVPVWPLLLAIRAALAVQRMTVGYLLPLATVPAVLALSAGDFALSLPGILLNTSLVLDGLARSMLMLLLILWLNIGWVLIGRQDDATQGRLTVYLLLVMSGSFGMALAGDAATFAAAAALAGYATYAVVQQSAEPGRHRGKWLLVALVVSDLLVFEALLLLQHAAGGLGFMTLGPFLATAPDTGLILGLILLGFGIRLGLPGVHFWVNMVSVDGTPVVRLVLLVYVFTAGLLAWLRLLPMGLAPWPETIPALQWLGWAGLSLVLSAALLRHDVQRSFGYLMTGLAAAWLLSLGSDAALWSAAVGITPGATALLVGIGMTALLLAVSGAGPGGRGSDRARLSSGAVAILLVLAGMLDEPIAVAALTALACLYLLRSPRAAASPAQGRSAVSGWWLLQLIPLGLGGLLAWLRVQNLGSAVLLEALWAGLLAATSVLLIEILLLRRLRNHPSPVAPHHRGSTGLAKRLLDHAGGGLQQFSGRVVSELTQRGQILYGQLSGYLARAEAWLADWVLALTSLLVLGILFAGLVMRS